MKPTPKYFTHLQPCTAIDIWKCFTWEQGFRAMQVDEAHSVIGLNSPRRLIEKRYLVKECRFDMDLYRLTDSGKKWLLREIKKRRYFPMMNGCMDPAVIAAIHEQESSDEIT
jgi:hypothetical protein